MVLLAATVAALGWANSPVRHGYASLWATSVEFGVAGWRFHDSLLHVVNDGLMALFFFVIALEIKREWVAGELRDRRAALLPALAALGGMVVPALLYVAFTAGRAGGHGWGIPMATDVAFALGVVALLGRRVPQPLKVFLLTLAIVDDVGAIVVIAVFYGTHLSWTWLAVAVGLLVVVALLARLGVRWPPVYVVLGVLAWYATYRCGVHATMVGVVLGLLVPARGDRLEELLHPWVSYLVVPLFALANAGVDLGRGIGGDGAAVTLGVAVGLVGGKTFGIAGASWLTVRAGLARLPAGVRWAQLVGIAAVAGIGFTVSLFVTSLAFAPGSAGAGLASHAKVGILGGSVVAALAGSALLALGRAPRRADVARGASRRS